MVKMYRHREDECFGLPRGGAIFGLFIGIIIILWGITEAFNIKIEFWPFIMIIFGVLVIAGALYGLTRSRQ